jgi:hypothetical protein
MRLATPKIASKLGALSAFALGLQACSSGTPGGTTTATTNGAATTSGTAAVTSGTTGSTGSSANNSTGSTGGSTGTTGSTTGGSVVGNVRLADLVAESGLVFDLCLTPHGTPFTTSSLGLLQGSVLGVAGGLPVGQVSAYLSVPSGSYDVVVMNGGEQDGCTNGYQTAGGPITVPAAGLTTLAMFGSLSSGTLGVAAFADDLGSPLPPSPRVRLVSAFAGVAALDFGTGFGATFSAIATDVAPGTLATLVGADANGYALTTVALQGAVAARLTGGNTLFVGDGFRLPSGGYGSMFLMGFYNQGQIYNAGLIVCDDSAGSLPNGTFPCSALQSKALLRLVHIITDTGGLDLCVSSPDAGLTQVAVLAGVPAGVGYSQSSAYVPVPAASDPNFKSDLTVIIGGGICSGPSILALPQQVLAPATFNTLVVEGLLDGGPYAAVALMMPVDEERAPADIVQDGGANVRLQTGAVGFGPVSAGTGPVGAGFDTIFTSVFGQPPTGIYGSAFNDASGYTPLVPNLSNVTFTFYNPGDPGNAVSQPNYNLPSVGFVSSAISVFVVGTGDINERNYALLQIDDQAAPVEGLLPVHYP